MQSRLRILSLNAGRTTTKETLLDRVRAGRGDGNTKVVRTFVKQLRCKLGDDARSPVWIFNERGVGYRMPRPVVVDEPRPAATAPARAHAGDETGVLTVEIDPRVEGLRDLHRD